MCNFQYFLCVRGVCLTVALKYWISLRLISHTWEEIRILLWKETRKNKFLYFCLPMVGKHVILISEIKSSHPNISELVVMLLDISYNCKKNSTFCDTCRNLWSLSDNLWLLAKTKLRVLAEIKLI